MLRSKPKNEKDKVDGTSSKTSLVIENGSMLLDTHSNSKQLEFLSIDICQAKKEPFKMQTIVALLEAYIMILNMDVEPSARCFEVNQPKRKKNCMEKFSQEVMNIAKEYRKCSINNSVYAKTISQDPFMYDKYEAIETIFYEVQVMDVEIFIELAMVEVLDEANQLYRDVERLVDAIYN